jgi:hypothetical protein
VNQLLLFGKFGRRHPTDRHQRHRNGEIGRRRDVGQDLALTRGALTVGTALAIGTGTPQLATRGGAGTRFGHFAAATDAAGTSGALARRSTLATGPTSAIRMATRSGARTFRAARKVRRGPNGTLESYGGGRRQQ